MTDAKTRQKQRRWMHLILTIFFAVHIPIAYYLFLFERELWERIAIFYVVVVSQWALVASHWAAFEAAHPPVEED